MAEYELHIILRVQIPDGSVLHFPSLVPEVISRMLKRDCVVYSLPIRASNGLSVMPSPGNPSSSAP